MRRSLCFLLAAFLALALRAQEAAESPARSGSNLVPGPATLIGEHVNVRGQPAYAGEVITKLSQGDVVTILEVIVREKTAPGEPAQWAKIRMPTNAPVFVFAQFLDATNKTVKPLRLNLRGGPGENFSVVGHLQRGDQVTEVLTVGEWTKIEAPTNAFAFVAAEFLQQTPPAAPPTPTPASEAPPASTPEAQPATPPLPVPSPAPSTNAEAAAPAPVPAAVPTEAAAPPSASVETPTNTPPTLPATAEPTPPQLPTNAVPEIASPLSSPATNAPPSRTVIREGIVRATISIQAPSDWELVDVRHRRPIAFLLPTTKELKLVRLWEKRVVVTGTESLERRWPNQPLLTIEHIETVPE